MREILTTLGLGLLASWLVERSPVVARRILRWNAAQLPSELHESYERDWLAELEYVEGNLSKLVFALKIALALPVLRHNLNLPPVSSHGVWSSMAYVNIGAGLALSVMGLIDIFIGSLSNTMWVVWVPAYWFAFVTVVALLINYVKTASLSWRTLLVSIGGVVFLFILNPIGVAASIGEFGFTVEITTIPLMLGFNMVNTIWKTRRATIN